MHKYLMILITCFILDCSNGAEKLEIKPKSENVIIYPSTNKINVIMQPIILVDSETCFQIVLQDRRDKIILANYDCGHFKERNYNLKKQRLNDCITSLTLENDTVKMWATYIKEGKIPFSDITILVKDKDSSISFIDTTFYFEVKRKK